MRKSILRNDLALILLLSLMASCSKSGAFGEGFLSGTLGNITNTNIDMPGSFSSYQPPANSKMTELKSNITGANDDIIKTIMFNMTPVPPALVAPTTKAELLVQLGNADETTKALYKTLFKAYGLSVEDCPKDDGIIVSDGEASSGSTLEDLYKGPSDQISCPFSVTAFSTTVKDDLNLKNPTPSTSAFTAALSSPKEDGLAELPAYLQKIGTPIDCSDPDKNKFFGSNNEYALSDFSTECTILTNDVYIGGVKQSYKIYDRLIQRDEMKSSLKNTILVQISEDSSAGEIKEYALAIINSSTSLKKDMAKFVKKEALDEFLQVSLNSFMTHGVNIFSMWTYLGYDIPEKALSLTGSNKDKLLEVFTNNRFKSIDIDTAKSDIFFAYKPGFRFFVDMFVDAKIEAMDSDGQVINDGDSATSDDLNKLKAAKKFHYYVNKENFCTYMVTTGSQGNTNDLTSGVASCLNIIEGYFDRLTFIHNMDTKTISVSYEDTNPNSLFVKNKVVDFVYSYDYNSDFRVDVDQFRKAAISIMQRELAEQNSFAASYNLDQGDIDLLGKITTSGIVSLRDQVQVGSQASGSRKSLADIGLSTFDSKLSISAGDFTNSSSNEGLYVKVPENTSGVTETINIYAQGTTDPGGFSSSSEGDVVLDIKKSSNLIYLDHDRSNNIFNDRIGINIPQVELNLPPYNLSERDLFIAYLNIDEYCDANQADVPAGYAGCDAQFKLTKPNNTTGDPLAVTKMYFKKYALGHHTTGAEFITQDWGFGLSPVTAKIQGSTVASNMRTLDDTYSISPVSVWAKINNSATSDTLDISGMSPIPLSSNSLPVGVYEASFSVLDDYKLKEFSSEFKVLANGDGSFARVVYDKISAPNQSARCSIPVLLSSAQATDNLSGLIFSDFTTALTPPFVDVISGGGTYSSAQYNCQ